MENSTEIKHMDTSGLLNTSLSPIKTGDKTGGSGQSILNSTVDGSSSYRKAGFEIENMSIEEETSEISEDDGVKCEICGSDLFNSAFDLQDAESCSDLSDFESTSKKNICTSCKKLAVVASETYKGIGK